MEVIGGAALPIHSWAADLEEGALAQARNCANLPVAFHHVAVMADGHQGYGVPIGAVLALQGSISPYAVGNDIGCGMALVPTTVTRPEFLAVRDELMADVAKAIPAGLGGERTAGADETVDAITDRAFDQLEEATARSALPLSTSQSPNPTGGRALDRAAFRAKGRAQVGTLGSGNHFLEVLADDDGRVWLMLHSGSRGIGGLVCNNFHRAALAYCADRGIQLPDPGLAWLPLDDGERWTTIGKSYQQAMEAALAYAHENRRRMLDAVGDTLERRFPDAVLWDDTVNIHHNDARLERHFGADVWVHRKGAVKAAEGVVTITPGSMGTGSYLGVGLGNPVAYESCSHGAGRSLSRGAARRQLALDDQLRLVRDAGGKVFAASTDDVLDEMPGAYKDLEAVMANQSDLVRAVRRLTPLATYKGSDPPKRRRKHK